MPDNRSKVLEMVGDGLIDKDTLIQDLLNWLSNDDVGKFCEHNDHPLSHDDFLFGKD